MDESTACLVRSFSQPAGSSSEPKEGDPYHALTTSISFGRFMTESLAWEKWSSFSCNRYLEEAEKSSKPGSVAEKKAYFEAHYKRIAAKKAAALLEQQNASSNDFPEPNILDDTPNNCFMVSESSKSNSHVVIDKMQGKEASNTELVLFVDANVSDSNVETDILETDKVEVLEPTTEQLSIQENRILSELPNQHENIEELSKTMSTQDEKKPIMDAANQGNFAPTSKKKQSISSSKSSSNIRASKLRSSVQLSPVQPSKEDHVTRTSKKTAKDLVDKKRLTPKSLHMSINFSSCSGETSKTSPIIQKIGNSKKSRSPVKTSRDSSNLLRPPLRASVNGLSVHPSAITQSERRRNKALDNFSVNGRRPADAKSQSPFIDRLNSSGASGSKARPPMVPSSFSLRCEERAAKRKEFFQKVEEKENAKQAEKVHLHAKLKDKAEDDFKKMRQSTTVFKAKPIANSHHERESPNHTKKIPLMRPQSPKLGRKPIPCMVKNVSQPPWRASVEIDSSKHVMRKSFQNPIHSNNSLLRKKNIHENASPNIQL